MTDGLEDSVCDDSLSARDTHYAMDHPRRGVAAIFNQRHFDGFINGRRGSQQDCVSLQRSFSRLGFDVELYSDLTLAKIIDTLKTLSQRDHSNCDCFALVFMSHGLDGKLRSKDELFDINLLWERFTVEKCSTLANKPKLFFIQACQGNDKQNAVLVGPKDEEIQDEKQVKLVPSYLLPDRADFLIALSTIPGFVSWRSTVKGTWYIQTLCRHLDSDGFHQDILTLLTNVGRTVALGFTYCEENSPQASNCKKQLPSIISLLIRTVKFTNKRQQNKKGCGRRRDCEITLKRRFSDESLDESLNKKIRENGD